MTEPILFYSTSGEYGGFSNFSRHPIKIDGYTYPTSEHYFQSKKFEGTKYEGEVRKARGPSEAARMGRDRSLPLRKDWESVKESVMYKALQAKFAQHTTLKELLLSTGDAELIEHTTNDTYWADGGGKGKGKNRLGVLLMRLREELRKAK